ncbi:transposase [Chryseobacterium cucumeris]|uniref:Transposase n=1 Tax=Chryseobacterium cucumeris TaxID=1813611 RepID=A0ABX9X4L7_9FLAO|nr:transposase [Chryseobacterium cucumeris]MDH5031897.1 transposase [Chryseobacterium cucumeris]MDH5036088.1 transposase [Chryseobacterium cucumeris]ROH90734.1 transposase [Chryseobacterium cucumeris]
MENLSYRKTIMNHYREILAFLERSTDAFAESFNAKIKNFRMQHRGVKDRTFFFFIINQTFCLAHNFCA